MQFSRNLNPGQKSDPTLTYYLQKLTPTTIPHEFLQSQTLIIHCGILDRRQHLEIIYTPDKCTSCQLITGYIEKKMATHTHSYITNSGVRYLPLCAGLLIGLAIAVASWQFLKGTEAFRNFFISIGNTSSVAYVPVFEGSLAISGLYSCTAFTQCFECNFPYFKILSAILHFSVTRSVSSSVSCSCRGLCLCHPSFYL